MMLEAHDEPGIEQNCSVFRHEVPLVIIILRQSVRQTCRKAAITTTSIISTAVQIARQIYVEGD